MLPPSALRRLPAVAATSTLALAGLVAVTPLTHAVTAPDGTGLELITDEIDPAQPRAEVLNVAVISDFGACGFGIPAKCADQNAVADMVHSWEPDVILTGGDNSQQQATEEQVRLSVEPYAEDIEAGRFFPIFGNHDYGNSCDAEGAKYSIEYLNVPVSYRAVLGNGLLEWVNPNGACETSSGDRMPGIYDDYIATVENSDATWVLTGVHQPPYSSGKSGNNLNRRWAIHPEVDLMISGHDHHAEHVITPDGDNLVVTGNGGDGTTDLFAPTTGSQWRDNENLGAMRLTITEESLRAEFVALGGETMYEFTLGHDADGDTVVLDQSEVVDPGTGTDPDHAVPARREVSFDVAAGTEDGLTAVQFTDGPWEQTEVDGRQAIQLLRNPDGRGNHLYLHVDDAAMTGGPYDMEAEVAYRSDVAGSFTLQYENGATGEAYSRATGVSVESDQVGTWQSVTVPLPAANFNNRQNGGADLRLLASDNLPVAVSAITIRSTVAEQEGVTATMVAGQEPDGLSAVEYPSGPFTVGEVDGRQALMTQANPDGATGNLYMAVDDTYLVGGPQNAWLTLTFRPEEAGRFQVQYENGAEGTTYFSAEPVAVTADQVGTWQTVTVALPDASFNNRQNGSADFRVRLPQNFPLVVSEMKLTTVDPATEPDPAPAPEPTEPAEPTPTVPGSVLNPVSWTPEDSAGFGPVEYESGPFTIQSDDTGSYLQVQRNPVNAGNNLYLSADDSRLFGGPHEVWFTIEYRSPVAGKIVLQYDDAATGTAYHSAEAITVSEQSVDAWQTATLHLPAALFQNRQNGSADMRLRGGDNLPFQVRSMSIALEEPTSPEEPTTTPRPGTVNRVWGDDRYGTAAKASAATFAPGVAVAYVATGDGYADAVTGAAAAAQLDGPTLLIDGGAIPAAVRDELDRLDPGRIVILGGTGVVPAAVAEELTAYTAGTVTRYGGQDRYETSAEISAGTFARGVEVAYIATGTSYPDALAGASAADGPVLLTAPTGLSEAVTAELERLAPGRIVVLGGEGAVPAHVERALGAYTEGSVDRLGGADRYETAAAISSAAFAPGVETAYVVTGTGYADAIPAVAAASGDSPVLLVRPGVLPSSTEAELARVEPRSIVVLGGRSAVSDDVVQKLQGFVR